jgi:hypothetical protein
MKIKNQTPYSLYARAVGAISGTALLLTCLAPSTQAANVLVNPGFESGGGLVDWLIQSSVTWNIQPGASQAKLFHSGANSMWTQGVYTGAHNITYAYQTIACAPGSTYTANAYFSQYVLHSSSPGEGGDPTGVPSGLFTSDAGGQEDGWVEVQFLGTGGTVLADYRSTIIDPAFVNNLVTAGQVQVSASGTNLTWVNCQVTNQYDLSQIVANADPDSYPAAITNTLGSGGVMTAPPGSVNVQFRLSLFQADYESGATYWDDASLNLVGGPAPSVIGSLSPDGSHFFNSVPNGFTFNVSSAASGGAQLPSNPKSGIKVVVNGADQSTNLVFTGNTQNWNVALPTVTSNQIYTISITVSNTAGLVSTANVSFDTFNTNAFVVYEEDYDFNGGQFIQNPIPTNAPGPNSYWGTAGTLGIDQQGAGSGGPILTNVYPNRTDGDVSMQVASDLAMPLYAAQNNPNIYNVNLAYNNANQWENYTRNPYPQGPSVIFARISGGGGEGVEYLNLLTSGYGTATFTTTNLGSFKLANGTSWSTYMWLPLTDANGNLVIVNLPAGRQTLQLVSGGNENVIDFLIVPAAGAGVPPSISGLNPPILTQTAFDGGTNTLAFTVTTALSTIPSGNIQVTLNGNDISSLLSITGTSTDWTVRVPIPQNQLLTLGVNVTDANGNLKSFTQTFDTFSQNDFMFEAEDWDFAGGQFIDNPVPTGNVNLALASPAADSYYYWPEGNQSDLAIWGVDYTDTNVNAGELYSYRISENAGTDVATDFLRNKFIVGGQTNSDYYVGWWNQGTWLNYTRTYPAGTYNVYGRLAGGAPYTGVTLGLVTAGVGTATQTVTNLGSFSDATANGWQNWHWVPMLNANGQLATVTLTGGVQTLQATAGTAANANYYMLTPLVVYPKLTTATAQNKLVIKIPTQLGFTYTVLWNNSLTGSGWQILGPGFAGTGSTVLVTNSVAAGTQFYKVMVQ